MKKISAWLICCIFLTGCVAVDSDFCRDCDISERDLKVQQMKDLYPKNEQFVDTETDETFTIVKHTREMTDEAALLVYGWPFMFYTIIGIPMIWYYLITNGVDYDYGMNVVSSQGDKQFIKYSKLGYYNLIPIKEYETQQQKFAEEEKKQQKKKQEEQKKRKEEQKKLDEQKHVKLLQDIEDCEQAIAKATEKRNDIPDEEIYIFNPYIVNVSKDGILSTETPEFWPLTSVNVIDFAKEGVFIRIYHGDWRRYFIYTKDTDYATNESFREKNFVYKKVGNYKYTAVNGSTYSVPAFKATKYKVSEINPKTYLKNKKLSCCQYLDNKEIGVNNENTGMYPGIFYGGYCKTKKHPNGIHENKGDFANGSLDLGENYYGE